MRIHEKMIGLALSLVCTYSFGDQGNTAVVNWGSMRNEIHVHVQAPNTVSLDRHLEVQGTLDRIRREAKEREAELMRMTKRNERQEKELVDLRKQQALDKQAYLELKKRHEQARGEVTKPSDAPPSRVSAESAGFTVPDTDAEVLVLMERSEADRANLSAVLAKQPERLDPILRLLVAKTESMDDKERNEWYNQYLPRMNLNQRIRLFDILSIERYKLADLERRYQAEIQSLNAKHLDEWLAFQRKRVDRNDPAALRSLARNLIDDGQEVHLKEAEEILRKLVRDNQKDGEAHYLLSLLCAARKQWQDAEDSITAALRQAPDMADYHVQAGKVFRQEKKSEKAREAFARAYRLGTTDRIALRSYVEFLREANQLDEAERVARKLLELYPKDDVSHLLLGRVLDEQDRFVEAEVHLKQAVALDGKDFFNHMALAWAYYKNGKYARAESAFGAAANLDGGVDAATMVGLSRAEQARYGEALQELQSTLKRMSSLKASKEDEAEIRLGAAVLLAEAGRLGEAKLLMADAAANSQGCSIGYMKTQRNWHERMLKLLGQWRAALCGA